MIWLLLVHGGGYPAPSGEAILTALRQSRLIGAQEFVSFRQPHVTVGKRDHQRLAEHRQIPEKRAWLPPLRS
jgi:hypothetical protein